MNSVFSGYGVYKPIYGIWQFIKDIPFLIKCCHQRIHKGYCVKDTWDVDHWFISVLKPMLEDLRKNHRGVPFTIEYEYWEEHKEELGLSQEDFMYNWPSDDKSEEHKVRSEALDKCDQIWGDILGRMVFLLNEMDEDTCSRQNPYADEWWFFHERFKEKYPKGGDELKTKEELAEERITGSKRLVWPSEDPEFGEEYEKISEKRYDYERELEEYRENCKDEFMDLFKKYFRNLWD